MATVRVIWTIALLMATLVSVSGCVSQYSRRLADVRRDFYDYGDPELAKKEISEWQKRAPEREQSVLRLNGASLALSTGSFEEAKGELVAVRDEFDALEEARLHKSAEDVLQFWADDNLTSYEGEDYEKVMIRATLALADLFDGGEDARAYAHQIAAKQDEIVMRGQTLKIDERSKNPKLAYPRVPLAPYLEGLIWEETYVNSGEAARCYEKVTKWRPQFKQGLVDLKRAQESVHSQPGHGRLYVFAFVGKGPSKIQGDAEVTQAALFIADRIFSATNKYSLPPTVAPVPIPELIVHEPRIASIGVDIDGERLGATETIADVNEMAIKQYNAVRDQLLARAVVRRVVKKGTIYLAKEAAQVNDWVSLAMDVGGVIWEATETADTRCWGLLPAKIQVWSVELPVGEHHVSFTPEERSGVSGGVTLSSTITINANRNTYALVTYPSGEPVGGVVVSKR